ncbi:spore coat protein YlbD [Virgibacillus sp. W0181]|uniref:spore coat protein YlbD n=1 Tax=Virgibacillus sp. W0181 TaxID=3391581 RepID=UPI003F46D760
MEDKLDPTVRAFKTFINRKPKLIEEVRKSGGSWQEIYEKWALLGDDDPYWDKYDNTADSSEENSSTKKKQMELFSQLMKYTEKIDFNKVQDQVQQLNKTIDTVQEVLGQFQDTKQSKTNYQNDRFRRFMD